MNKIEKIIYGSVGVFALTMMLSAGPADAARKGPRASLSAATVCALDGNILTVTIRLYDKSSGSAVPVVTLWDIDVLAKTERGNWSNQVMFDGALGAPELDLADIVQTFDLSLMPPPADAKAVNASVSVTYESAVPGGDARTIENMCSDDPNTEDVEPSGIKL